MSNLFVFHHHVSGFNVPHFLFSTSLKALYRIALDMNGATAWPCIHLLRAFEHITAICLHSYVGASPGYKATMDVLASLVLAMCGFLHSRAETAH